MQGVVDICNGRVGNHGTGWIRTNLVKATELGVRVPQRVTTAQA
jgi:hypothetical protein